MRKSLLYIMHIAQSVIAWLTAPVFAIGIGPTTSPTPIAYGSLTPGLGMTQKPKWHGQPVEGTTPAFAKLKNRATWTAPAAALNLGQIRHRATTLFKRFLEGNHNRQSTGWMVTT